MKDAEQQAGPILHFRGQDHDGVRLAAINIWPSDVGPPPTVRTAQNEIAPCRIATVGEMSVWRHDFRLAQCEGGYGFGAKFHPVVTDLTDDMRIAFVSCNGEEHGDLDRDGPERNLMWSRLADEHARAPFALLLQGGDQIYADEATQGHPLSKEWPDRVLTDPDAGALAGLEDHLRAGFLERYLSVLAAPDCAGLFASVPALSIWDDHDICDGWGSLPEAATDSRVGRVLFRVARQMYLLFQHGATEADIPDLFFDPSGQNLGWRRDLPGLTIFAPDLRSERRRRRVMDEAGWQGVESIRPEAGAHTLMVSSVPLLGPRLSLLESVMGLIPRMQHYEDDLRDQWQSHAHREEWRRMLRQVLRMREAGPVTVLSGEIHLATRAEMGPQDSLIHQLVASGISHRAPPSLYARALGWLAGLAEAPLAGHPISVRPLPGHGQRYIAERNFLTLDRRGRRWQAVWHLEHSGQTQPLPLD